MGIGSAGTTAVDPSNPLYDAVKAGGGYVKDEETGEVTGGPDGDGTARTEEERKAKANNPMGDPDLIENDDSEDSTSTDTSNVARDPGGKVRNIDNTSNVARDPGGKVRNIDDTSEDVVTTTTAQASDDTTLLLGAAAATAVGALVVWRVL